MFSASIYSQDFRTKDGVKVVCAKELNCYLVQLEDSIGPANAKLIIETLRTDFNLHRAFFDTEKQFFIFETVSKIKQKQLENYISYKTKNLEKIDKSKFLKSVYINANQNEFAYHTNFYIR